MSKIFINIFIPEPSEYVHELEDCLRQMTTLSQLEFFLKSIATEYYTDKYGTTTWVNDDVIISSGFYPQFEVPLSVSVKRNAYGNTADQIACWDGFRKVCEIVKSGEYV